MSEWRYSLKKLQIPPPGSVSSRPNHSLVKMSTSMFFSHIEFSRWRNFIAERHLLSLKSVRLIGFFLVALIADKS